MLQTVEAEIDVNGNVRLLEAVRVEWRTRALVTLLDETNEQTWGSTAAALEFLRTRRLPEAARSTPGEIEAQIQENRELRG